MPTRRLKPLESDSIALIPDVREVDALDELGQPVVGLPLGKAVHPGDEAQKVADAHVGIGWRTLRQIAETAARLDRPGVAVVALDEGLPGGRLQESADDLHCGRLAGAVGP